MLSYVRLGVQGLLCLLWNEQEADSIHSILPPLLSFSDLRASSLLSAMGVAPSNPATMMAMVVATTVVQAEEEGDSSVETQPMQDDEDSSSDFNDGHTTEDEDDDDDDSDFEEEEEETRKTSRKRGSLCGSKRSRCASTAPTKKSRATSSSSSSSDSPSSGGARPPRSTLPQACTHGFHEHGLPARHCQTTGRTAHSGPHPPTCHAVNTKRTTSHLGLAAESGNCCSNPTGNPRFYCPLCHAVVLGCKGPNIKTHFATKHKWSDMRADQMVSFGNSAFGAMLRLNSALGQEMTMPAEYSSNGALLRDSSAVLQAALDRVTYANNVLSLTAYQADKLHGRMVLFVPRRDQPRVAATARGYVLVNLLLAEQHPVFDMFVLMRESESKQSLKFYTTIKRHRRSVPSSVPLVPSEADVVELRNTLVPPPLLGPLPALEEIAADGYLLF
jgi:hypothetical protein